MEAADSSEFLYTSTRLYGFTSQSTVIFKFTDMMTAKLTQEWHFVGIYWKKELKHSSRMTQEKH
jgi:hypothetical protein